MISTQGAHWEGLSDAEQDLLLRLRQKGTNLIDMSPEDFRVMDGLDQRRYIQTTIKTGLTWIGLTIRGLEAAKRIANDLGE